MPTAVPARSRLPVTAGARRYDGQHRDAFVWLALVGAGAALTALAVALDARVGTDAPPFTGRYQLRLGAASLLAPAVAAVVLAAVRAGWTERLPWRRLLAVAYLAAAAWALSLALVEGGDGLAGPVGSPDGYQAAVASVQDDPIGYLRDFVAEADRQPLEARQHPPAPVLLLWSLEQAGLNQPVVLGVLASLVGCLAVPLVAVATRSLCHEPSARRLLPALVLAPYAVWVAVSMDAVTLALTAGAVTCGVVGSEPGRRPRWAAAAGVLLGVAALFSYSAPWLGCTLIVTYFVRRRALLNVVTGMAALAPLALARLAGFVWPDGLAAAQAQLARQIAPYRSWPLWVLLDLLLLLVAAGPVVVAAAHKLGRTPGWPFVVGAGLAVAFAIASGLSRGEVERSFLPFLPWLLVPAVAPRLHPDPGAEPTDTAAPTPVTLVALGAATAIVVEAVVRSPW